MFVLESHTGPLALSSSAKRRISTDHQPARCGSILDELFRRRRDHDAPIQYVTLLAPLQINRAWQAFVTVECPPGDTGNLLIVDNRLPILYHRDVSSH